MATIRRGDTAELHESTLTVGEPGYYGTGFRVEDDIEIYCSDDNGSPWGFPIKISMSHDEALLFCSKLMRRLAMTVEPPEHPRVECLSVGEDILGG